MRRFEFTARDHYPLWLHEQEMREPGQVIAGFYGTYPLPECRHYIWELFNAALLDKEAPSACRLGPGKIAAFTTGLMCLIEATDLLNKKLETKTDGLLADSAESSAIIPEWVLQDEELLAIVQLICKSMDTEKIFLLGKYPLRPVGIGEEYDLLVLVKNSRNRPMEELESLIQNRSQDLAPVFATILKLSKVNEWIASGNVFLSSCCTPDKLVYDAGKIPLNSSPSTVGALSSKKADQEHHGLITKAQGFLKGATLYLQQQEFALSAFMLHQAVEYGLNAVLAPLMGYRLKTHSLHKQLRHLRRFSQELFHHFPRDTAEEVLLFQYLQRAYVHARYKDSFTITSLQTELLFERVASLLQKIYKGFPAIKESYSSKNDLVTT